MKSPSIDAVLMAFACGVADYALRQGLEITSKPTRPMSNHLGAVLADTILQAGLNYRTVVRGRVQRILVVFPDATTLTGLRRTFEIGSVSDFLQWYHPTKIERFIALVDFLASEDIDDTNDLKIWLFRSDARHRLLSLRGIGPKSYDYMRCLLGIDCVAVDRHIKTFAAEAGLPRQDYETLSKVVSFAADLLGVARRDFDAWIWEFVSQRKGAGASLA